jgi:hypothetical protein
MNVFHLQMFDRNVPREPPPGEIVVKNVTRISNRKDGGGLEKL